MHHIATPRGHTLAHGALLIVLFAGVLLALHGSALAPAVGAAGAALVVAHVGLLAVLLFALRRREQSHGQHGYTLHSARAYDLFTFFYTRGQESRLRASIVDAAGVAAGDRVLDVCCGTGTLAMAVRARVGPGGTVAGVDASPEMIARAREKAQGSVELQVAPAQALPYADSSFDVVFCTLGYHHLPEDVREAALREMRRVLRPGGRAVIVEFGRTTGLAALQLVAMLHTRNNPDLLAEVSATMRRVGLTEVKQGALGFRGLSFVVGTA